MDLYLLRHGETDWNKAGLLQGHTDIPLNENGRKQMRETARKLGDLGVKMDVILSSPLHRARESAEIAGIPDRGYHPGTDADRARIRCGRGPDDGRERVEVPKS